MNRALRLLAVGCVVTGVCRVCAQVPLASPNLVFDDAGGIRIIAAASDGGYLIAGDFRSVHGAGRAGFAKVTSNGSVVTAFDPAPDRAIKAIAVAGTSAFVIGDFTAVAGVSRPRFARISTVDGALDPNFDPAPDVAPLAIATDAAGNVYAAGNFTSIGGLSGRKLVRLDPATGAADPAWNPVFVGVPFEMTQMTLAVNGPWLYVGGKIVCDSDGMSGALRRVSLSTGQVDPNWNPLPEVANGADLSLVFDAGGDVFVNARPGLSVFGDCESGFPPTLRRVSATSGGIMATFTAPPEVSFPAAGDGSNLYATVLSTTVFGREGGGPLMGLVRLDPATGAVVATAPALIHSPRALLATPTSLLLAIDGVVSLGSVASHGLLAMNKATLVQLPLFLARVLRPGAARKLARAPDGKVYVGGDFRFVDGVERNNLARLNADGTLDPAWTTGVEGSVSSLLLHGNHLYVGGYFVGWGGVLRMGAAKFDIAGAFDGAWNPNLSDPPRVMLADNGAIYLGGIFSTVGGVTRRWLARVSETTGALDNSFVPSVNSDVPALGIRTLAITGNSIIAGGVGRPLMIGANKRHLAKLDKATGVADLSWDPNPTGSVRALLTAGAHLYVGGDFNSIGGQPSGKLARVALATGALDTAWNAGNLASNLVFTIARSSAHVYTGGIQNSLIAGATRHALADGSRDVAWAPVFSGASLAGAASDSAMSLDGTRITFAIDAIVPREGIVEYATPPSETPRLANISTRAQVLTGDDVVIGGFVIGGSANKTVAIVATGPSLSQFGISNPLANPTLRLVRSDGSILATNDDWQADGGASQLQVAGLEPSHSLEAALLVSLPPGAYTAIVEGAGGGTGVSVIGVYEVGGPTVPLMNISTRGRVGTGIDVMIGGFVIQGAGPQTVAIAATGPSLAQYGITSPLTNPKITLVRSSDQTAIATNDDWQADANASQLQMAGLAPSDPRESGLYRTLQPGAYTVIVEGVGGATGVSVIGVYKVN